jgi:polysaccharide biosynthesis/export protein
MHSIKSFTAIGRRVSVVVLVAGLIGACSPGSSLLPLPEYDGINYRLGVGDQVRLITFGVEPLTGTFRIDDGGNLDLPLVGMVHAAGLTPGEFRQSLTSIVLQKKLLNAPSLSVEVLEYRPIFVLGEVNHPGQYPYQPGMRVLTAVAVAGGFTYRAVEGHVRDLRSVTGTAVTGKAGQDAFVAPGDVITVLERYF